MSLAADRPEFAPPPTQGTPRAVAFALLAHALLIAALTWGVHWKRDAENDAVEAELWSTTVQQAAPRLSQPPTPTPAPVPPPPTPAPPPPPPPPPPPAPRVQAPEPAPTPRPPDIALEREKKLKEQKEREREIEQAKQEKKMEAAKKAAQEKKALDAKRQAEEAAEDKREAQEKAQADARKKKEAETKDAKLQADAAKKKEADAKLAAADRAATLKRMQGMAGASGDENATGNALKSSGPSGSYGGRVAAAVRPNVVFPDADMVSGNPGAEFEVKLAPDGTIVGTPRMVKSSGLPAWDQAALRALQKTEKLPRDVDGRVPSALIVELKPKR